MPERCEPATELVYVSQHSYHRMACGPASLLNSLLAGDVKHRRAFAQLPVEGAEAAEASRTARSGAADGERLRRLVETGGALASCEESGTRRFEPRTGVGPFDLLAWAKELRATLGLPGVSGAFLDRRAGVEGAAHLHRVHGLLARSIEAGVAPVVRMRLFSADAPRPGAVPKWEGVRAHWVSVLEVPQRLRSFDAGFELVYADPDTGAAATAYVHLERERNFTAAKGSAATWEWVSDRPFLLVEAPSLKALGRGRIAWHRRAIVTLDYSIHASH